RAAVHFVAIHDDHHRVPTKSLAQRDVERMLFLRWPRPPHGASELGEGKRRAVGCRIPNLPLSERCRCWFHTQRRAKGGHAWNRATDLTVRLTDEADVKTTNGERHN